MAGPITTTPFQRLGCRWRPLRLSLLALLLLVAVVVSCCCCCFWWEFSQELQYANDPAPSTATKDLFDMRSNTMKENTRQRSSSLFRWYHRHHPENNNRDYLLEMPVERHSSYDSRKILGIKSSWFLMLSYDLTLPQDESSTELKNEHKQIAESRLLKFPRQVIPTERHSLFGFTGRRRLNNVTTAATSRSGARPSSGYHHYHSAASGGSGGFTIPQSNKYGVPKYDNCNDDNIHNNATGPCSGYTSSSPTYGFHAYSVETVSPAPTHVAVVAPSRRTGRPTMGPQHFGLSPTSPTKAAAPSSIAPTRAFQTFNLTFNPTSVASSPPPARPTSTGSPTRGFQAFRTTTGPIHPTLPTNPSKATSGAPTGGFHTFGLTTSSPTKSVASPPPTRSAPFMALNPPKRPSPSSSRLTRSPVMPPFPSSPAPLNVTASLGTASPTTIHSSSPAATSPINVFLPRQNNSVVETKHNATFAPAFFSFRPPRPTVTMAPSSPSLASQHLENVILLDASVLQSSSTLRNDDISQQISSVMNNILNHQTPFPTFPAAANDTLANRTFTTNTLNSSIFLVQDPNDSNVSVFRTLSSTTSWRHYAVGYRCFKASTNTPIQNETLLHWVYSTCQVAIDESIRSGNFLYQLAAAANQSHVLVLNVTIPGMEDFHQKNDSGITTTSTFSPRSYPQPLSTKGLDLRRWIGLAMALVTVGGSALLMLLGARREDKLKNEELWGFPLSTEEDVGKLLNLGFMWQQEEEQAGPPKKVVVFNKEKFGYRDDDSTLLGGFHSTPWVMDAAEVTLPSSGTSRDVS